MTHNRNYYNRKGKPASLRQKLWLYRIYYSLMQCSHIPVSGKGGCGRPERAKEWQKLWLHLCHARFNLASQDSHECEVKNEALIKSNLVHAAATETAMKSTAAQPQIHLGWINANPAALGRR